VGLPARWRSYVLPVAIVQPPTLVMQGLKVGGYTQMETDYQWSLISCRQIIERTSLWTTKTAAMHVISGIIQCLDFALCPRV
jgi:hypothetical protein